MNREKLKEILIANGVLVGVVSLLFSFWFNSIFPVHYIFAFLFAVLLSTIGQSFFLQGVESSLVKVGNHTGQALMKNEKDLSRAFVWLCFRLVFHNCRT